MSSTFVILCDPRANSLGEWLRQCLSTDIPEAACALTTVDEAAFPAAASTATTAVGPAKFFVVVPVFFDGLSDEARRIFAEMKSWAAKKAETVALQAMNAKRGEHTLQSNAAAVVTSLRKRLPTPAAPAGGATHPAEPSADAPTPQGGGGDSIDTTPVVEPTPALVRAKVRAGQGECFWLVRGSTREEFVAQKAALVATAAEVCCGLCPLLPEPRELGGGAVAQEFLIRNATPGQHMELRFAMCGNVDSGKSTLTSVLTYGQHDDGRGSARALVFNHRHEAQTGRTSSISENHVGFNAEGRILSYNYDTATAAATAAASKAEGEESPPPAAAAAHSRPRRALTSAQLVESSSKILTLYDLAGHEKYLRTTVLGMTRNIPDYGCIVVSANNGIQRMTKEHLGLCLALKIPFFVVITRIDATPENIRQETFSSVNKLMKHPNVKKLPYPIRSDDDIVVCAKNLHADRITPIFEVSNVTGQGMTSLVRFLNMLPTRHDWADLAGKPKEMVIDSTFFVSGVGTVVGGIILSGVFHINDTVLLGPDGLGNFRHTQIKSIHVKGVDVTSVTAGNDAALCLKKERRNAVRKGNVLVCPTSQPVAHWQFQAEIVILYHSTTIAPNYEPVIHSTTVRQSARIVDMQQEVLRTGDRSIVKFHFLYRPEFIKIGQRLIFREGRTKGIGTIVAVIPGVDDRVVGNSRQRMKEITRATHAGGSTAPPAAPEPSRKGGP